MVLGPLLRTALSFGFCNILKAENIRNDTLRRVIPGADPNFGFRGRALYASYCDEPPEFSDPPFEGGQCEFCYRTELNYTGTNNNSSLDGNFTSIGFMWGPISNPTFSIDPPGQSGRQWRYTVTNHGRCNVTRSLTPVRDTINVGSVGVNGNITVNSFTNSPRDGQIDECGNLPDAPPPPDDPGARQFPIDITVNYNDGTDLTFVGNVAFGFAFFDTDFNLNIPIKFFLENNVNLTGNFNFDTGDVTVNYGDEFDLPLPPPPDGDYRTDPDDNPPPTNAPPPPGFTPPFPPAINPPPDDDKDFDDDEPQQERKIRRIIGVLVDTIQVPPLTSELLQGDNPEVYIPDIGLVNFGYLIDGNKFYWGEDVRVKNRRQVIFTPSGRYAVTVEGTLRQGGQWQLTPIYAEVPVEVGVPL